MANFFVPNKVEGLHFAWIKQNEKLSVLQQQHHLLKGNFISGHIENKDELKITEFKEWNSPELFHG